jgi:hypothetical protein
MIRFAVGFAIAVLLAGCNDEGQEKALAQCEFSALPTYKEGWQTMGPESHKYINYIQACMKGNGFEYNIRPLRCTVGFFTEHNHYCYSPTSEVSYFFWRVRMQFDGGLIDTRY